LEDSIVVYHMKNQNESRYPENEGLNNVRLEDVGFDFLNKPYVQFSTFTANTQLKTQTEICKKTEKEFELTARLSGSGTNEESLRDLISVSDQLSEIVKNPDKVNAVKSDSWTKAEFKSALYDLKTRKFKCTALDYSEAGRVCYIEFKEMK